MNDNKFDDNWKIPWALLVSCLVFLWAIFMTASSSYTITKKSNNNISDNLKKTRTVFRKRWGSLKWSNRLGLHRYSFTDIV